MANPSPFQVGREVATNFGNEFTRMRDENAIEKILAQAAATNDPETVRNSIGKILSQVSPERRGDAIQFLQGTYASMQKRQEQQQEIARKKSEQEAQFAREREAGLSPGLAPAVQVQQLKDRAKAQRLSQYGLGGEVSSNGQPNPSFAPPNVPNQIPGGNTEATDVPARSFLNKLSKDQLVLLTGHPDKEISEPASAQLKQIENQEKIAQGQKDAVFKSDLARSNKFIEETDEISSTIPQQESALSLMEDAIANRNLSYFSRDNLAEIFGVEGFRSQEGAIFKTAGKEYFLGNIARAGARPNQWIEQQISDMMTKVGRSTEANLSVARALRNELELKKERVRLTDEISNDLKSKGDLSQSQLTSKVNKQLSQYAEKKQLELFNDLRAIKAIAEKEPQKFRKVEPGTPVSKVVAQALLRQFNNDPKKAADEAKKLGYTFE